MHTTRNGFSQRAGGGAAGRAGSAGLHPGVSRRLAAPLDSPVVWYADEPQPRGSGRLQLGGAEPDRWAGSSRAPNRFCRLRSPRSARPLTHRRFLSRKAAFRSLVGACVARRLRQLGSPVGGPFVAPSGGPRPTCPDEGLKTRLPPRPLQGSTAALRIRGNATKDRRRLGDRAVSEAVQRYVHVGRAHGPGPARPDLSTRFSGTHQERALSKPPNSCQQVVPLAKPRECYSTQPIPHRIREKPRKV